MSNAKRLNLNDARATAAELSAIERIAASMLEDEPALLGSLDFGPFVTQGEGGGSRILIGDQSEIPLLSIQERPFLDHRMAMLARPGDLVVLRRPIESFFDYLSEVLGIRNVSHIGANHDMMLPIARLCRTDPDLHSLLMSKVAEDGGVTLLSYLTTGNTWRLAQSLGKAAQERIYVAGPSPRLARRVNDKLWFADLASRVLGRDAVPPTMRAFGPAAAAGLVRHIARQGEQVIVKVPDSAGSSGNIRLDSGDIASAPLSLVHRFLRRRLNAIGWTGRYPILVGVWDSDVVCSPSVQLWLPERDAGPPHIDGIFEQHVRGLGGDFVGAERSALPDRIQLQLASEALRIALILQRIGYFGRCSFDAVLVKGRDAALQPHWIECNGRWGGVSIPMKAASNFCRGSLPEGLVVLQAPVGTRPLTMADIRSCLEPLLFRTVANEEGVVIMAPPSAAAEPQLTLMAIATDQARAQGLMEAAVTQLLSWKTG